jgi:hypothetical protein
LTDNQSGGERREKDEKGRYPSASPENKGLQNSGEHKRKKSQFFFKAKLQKSPKEEFPEKMKRKRDEYLKSKKDRKAFYDKSGNGKLASVFGIEKKKIVGKDKNNNSDRGKSDARAHLSKGKAEIFEGFFENKYDSDSRENGKKKKREPECFAVGGLGKNQADDENKSGAKTDQEIPAGEFFAICCFDEVQGHKFFVMRLLVCFHSYSASGHKERRNRE